VQLTYVTFNFKGSDIAAEEKHYFDYHAALAKSLPGVSMYLTGRLRAIRSEKPKWLRAAMLGFQSESAAASAMAGEGGTKLIADTQARLGDLRIETFNAEAVVPFAAKRPGRECFVVAAGFDFRAEQGGLEKAERRYRTEHVELARKLPGLRAYLVARLGGPGGAKAERQRIAILAFDSFEAFREAFRSPVGVEVGKDGDATLSNMRVEQIDARIEV
jgi:uncharacterized protein (TIGR02118 family)